MATNPQPDRAAGWGVAQCIGEQIHQHLLQTAPVGNVNVGTDHSGDLSLPISGDRFAAGMNPAPAATFCPHAELDGERILRTIQKLHNGVDCIRPIIRMQQIHPCFIGGRELVRLKSKHGEPARTEVGIPCAGIPIPDAILNSVDGKFETLGFFL